MKLNRIVILFIIMITFVQARPHWRYYPDPYYNYYRYNSIYASRYYSYYPPYVRYRTYIPVVTTTRSTTTYPSNLVLVTADSIAEDITGLKGLFQRGLITERDFERAKKTLLNRIGMSVNPAAAEPTTEAIVSQIETLHHMLSGELLTKKEYLKQKNKLLALI